MKPTLENGKKPLSLGLILASFVPNLVHNNVFHGSTSTRCYTLLQAINICNLKEN